MYQFFVEEEQVHSDSISITGGDVNHIKNVLRMKNGEKIRVSSKSGQAYFCHISSILDDEVIAAIDSADETGTELDNHIVLYQGLPKGDKMELIIQKAVELGVSEIVPVAMKNCVVKLDEKKAAKKLQRWQAIAESAAKQSKRTVIPTVKQPVTYKEALKIASELDITLVPYENERGMDATREIMGHLKAGQTIGVVVGPEGGFAPEEIALVDEHANAQNKLGTQDFTHGDSRTCSALGADAAAGPGLSEAIVKQRFERRSRSGLRMSALQFHSKR